MALAKIKTDALPGRDYIKYNFGEVSNYPRITRDWSKVPVQVLYHIEKNNVQHFLIKYEDGEEPYNVKKTKDITADEEIDRMLGKVPEPIKPTPTVTAKPHKVVATKKK